LLTIFNTFKQFSNFNLIITEDWRPRKKSFVSDIEQFWKKIEAKASR